MDAHIVRLLQRLFEGHILDPGFLAHEPVRMPQRINLLDRSYKRLVLVRRVIAQRVHVEADTLLDERQSNPASANDLDGLASHFVAQKRQVWMPESQLV